ncbi:hypothetical protein AAC387_Pa05g1340 [Persea americana]
MIVLADGSRILGLGDLGIQGIGIAIGKLDLYFAAAGRNPQRIFPGMIDVGTNNENVLNHPLCKIFNSIYLYILAILHTIIAIDNFLCECHCYCFCIYLSCGEDWYITKMLVGNYCFRGVDI